MKVRYLFVPVVFILLFQGFVVSSFREERSTDLAEGQHQLYIVKEIVEMSGGYTDVVWIQGPVIAGRKYKVLEGADASELRYDVFGLTVRVSQRWNDTRKVVIEVEALVLRGDMTALVNITGGASKTELYVYNQTEGGFAKLGEFLLEEGDPAVFQLDLSALYDTPSATANIQEAVKELDNKVFAFYYQWYASPEGPSGWTFHWNEGFTDFPLMGLYDSADERVIYSHMEMAKYAGIDFLIADYPYHAALKSELWPTMLSIAEETGLKVTHYGLRMANLSEISTWVSHPAFLKDSGRPVFFFYSPQIANASEWLDFREMVEASLGPVVFIGNTIDEEYLGAFDGFHVYVCLAAEDGGKQYYSDAIERLEIGPSKMDIDEAFSLAYSGKEVNLDIKLFSVTVIPGYDDTEVRDPGIKIGREEGEVYARFWRTAIDLDAHSVLITSWNEWHEGTEIEPSREYGFDYINMTRRLIEEYKQTSIPMPEADFSATVESLRQYPDLTGDGSIVLAAIETPALYVNVSVSGEEGVSSLDLQGDFYTYLKNQNGNAVSVVIPSVPSQSELVVRAVYEAESIRPLFDISVTAYDVLGRLYEIYKGQLRPSMESVEETHQVTWNADVYFVRTLSNSTVSNFFFNGSAIQIGFNVSGLPDTEGFCNVTIPKDLLRGDPWTVTIVTPITDFIQTENATHTFLCFTYTHASTLEVIIQGTWVIPEFPSFVILPLFMVTTLLAVIVYRKKQFI